MKRSVSACTSSSARPSTATACISRTTSACTAATMQVETWTEITEGLPTEFGFAAATHPHDRDTFYVIPLDPGHGRTMPEGHAAVWRTRDAGSSWQRLDRGLPQRDAYVGVLREAMAVDSRTHPASTSARARGRSSRAPTKATRGRRLPTTSRRSPRSRSLRSSNGGRPSPVDAGAALPGLPRQVNVQAATVRDVIDHLEHEWPGFATVCASPDRRCAVTFTCT